MTQPLARIEAAIAKLGADLEPVQALPRIEQQLTQVNDGIAAVLEALNDVRDELQGRRHCR